MPIKIWQQEADFMPSENCRGFLTAFDNEEAASGADLIGQRQTILFRSFFSHSPPALAARSS
jgi:hypothetical protein